MRGLCGWFGQDERQDGEACLAGMLDGGRARADARESRSGRHAGLAVHGERLRPRLVDDDGCWLALSGHPRRIADGARALDAVDVLRALRDRGAAALAEIGGDFALAFWDASRRSGLLAVDRIGVHRMFYRQQGRALVFGTSLDFVTGFPEASRRLSSQALFDYVYYHVTPGPGTIYEQASRLPPGHAIEFGHRGAGAPSPYWQMRFDEDGRGDSPAMRAELSTLMRDAVGDLDDMPGTGTFLSGGIDSSTVTGMLARTRGGAVAAFSIGFDAKGYDEMAYARLAARHFGAEHHEYYVTPQDVVNAVPLIATSYDQPFGNASAVPTYYCAKVARDHGMQRLLAGDGGDELFGGNERYAKYHLLGLYQHLPALLRSAFVEPLLLSVPGTDRVPVVKKLRSYVLQARPPMPQRYTSYNLLMHLGVEQVFTPEFLRTIDAHHPEKLLADAHRPYADASLINQMLGIDLRFILADGDLPKVTQMCDLAGIDVAFPMLDERLIAFSQHLGSRLKLRGTALRWFFKQSMSDLLPHEVITKTKHGFGLPVGDWLVGHQPLFELAADSIGTLRQRGIVESRLIDDLLGQRLREHPAYFGTMLWVLMMLGLWLESRKL
ncbi:asparagine synthetase B family protein [Piscinibacter defluvii]|uniref:asparagine synthetase B family protein n=1 Tax=Piscinibacter defluvii TaxID=1796922 RepID=UPI000FDDA35B|nr:asparagine synthase-related protein [Piscinibacter defluvii]